MGPHSRGVAGATLAGLVLLGAAGAAWAQAQPVQQVLDRVIVHDAGTALEMRFDDAAARPPDFTDFQLAASTGLASCQLNGTRGVYCLDGRDVRRWPDPEAGGPGQVEFSCANAALGLDTRRADTCSTIAVAQNGTVWIAGRRGKAYSLIKVLARAGDGSCPEGQPLAPVGGVPSVHCFREYAAGRPLLARLVIVEGEQAAAFDPGSGTASAGVLGLDERATVTLFGPQPGSARDLVAGKAWGLAGKERALDLALLQVANGGAVDNHLLVATSYGRVLARQTDAGAATTTRTAYDAPAERLDQPHAPVPVQCDFRAQRYGLAASARTGRVYLTDRNYCQVAALKPTDGDEFDGDDAPFTGLLNVSPGGEDLTLSTVDTTVSPAVTRAPDGVAVAPGITIDLVDCRGSCTLVADAGSQPVARLFDVQLAGEQSRMVLFQVRNIPDCRYTADPACVPGAVIGPAGRPGEQYLDVAKLLPTEVTDQFRALDTLPPGLPPLLISPQYRGQAGKGYRFGAFFGIPEPGVVFINTFTGEFDVAGLSGSELGCRLGYGPGTPLAKLLRWDVVTWVSERYVTPGGPAGLDPTFQGEPNRYRYVDTLTNTGCGTTRSGGTRWSLAAYDLEIAHNPGAADDQDDVFALLLAKLFDDLEATQSDIACRAGIDGAGSAPLAAAACANLAASLLNAEDKLTKCIAAARQPKQSAADQNCRSFEVQFAAYRGALDAIGPASPALDPANRIGELKARAQTLSHVYFERFLPSIPAGGFTAQ